MRRDPLKYPSETPFLKYMPCLSGRQDTPSKVRAENQNFLLMETQAIQSSVLKDFNEVEMHRPAAEGGQPAQLGRKAKGCFVEELDKSYQRLGLRK